MSTVFGLVHREKPDAGSTERVLPFAADLMHTI
jgi:hypothetical protein